MKQSKRLPNEVQPDQVRDHLFVSGAWKDQAFAR